MLYLCFLCFFATLLATELRSWRLSLRYCRLFASTQTFHNSPLIFIQNATPSKAESELHSYVWPGGYFHLVCAAGAVSQLPLPRLQLPQLSWTRPLQSAEQKPPLSLNSTESKTSIMKSLVHDCQVDHSHWNYDIIDVVRWLVVNCCCTLNACQLTYRKNSKIWDTSNNCHNCPKNRKVWCNIA